MTTPAERAAPVPGRRSIRTVALLTNPVAGRGRARTAARRAGDRLAARGVAVRELVGRDATHSRELAGTAVADGIDALVVVGGDGMTHLALPAVAGTTTPLGVIPAGTGNDQARAYGWPRSSPAAAADIVADGYMQLVDVGVAVTADGRRSYFGSVLAAGFDSLVSDRTNRLRWPHGRARYDLAMLVEFARLRPLPFSVSSADGAVIDDDLLLVAVGNTTSYGGGMRICPAAQPDDGVLDVTIGGAVSRRTALAQLPRLYRGTHVTRPEVRTLRTSALRIDSPGINAYADGEYLGPLPVEITVRPRSLSLLVPRPPTPR